MVLLYRTARRTKGLKFQLKMMVTKGNWAVKELAEVMGVLNKIYTFVAFAASCSLVPMLCGCHLVMNFLRDTWVNFLEKRFTDLEFVRKISVRMAMDTHRNMGVVALLVTVKGHCDPDAIKQRLLDDILDKRRNDGRYAFRHLRMSLTTRWGRYAWQEQVPFDIDNHLIIASSFYRGRPVSESNIQECVSEIVSKYLTPELPPWQITVIPSFTGPHERFYLLIRIHHMLLSQEGLDLGDLLLTSQEVTESQTKSSLNTDTFNMNTTRRPHPFQDLYKKPVSLPALYDQLSETFSNYWNEFLSNYDPVENPYVLKNPSIKKLGAIALITSVAITKHLINSRNKKMIRIVKAEIKQRGISVWLVVRSVANTLNPIKVTIKFIKFFVNLMLSMFIKWPVLLVFELRYMCMMYNEAYVEDSYSKTIHEYWKRIRDAFKESWYFAKLVYNGPRIIIEELFLTNRCKNQLQTVSLCGRKVVSWSDPIPTELINHIEDATGASSSEILLTAATASLTEYFRQYGLHVPDSVLTSARYFPQEQLMQTSHRKIISTTGGGVLCLALPTRNPFGEDDDPVACLHAVQQVVLRARLRQPALYLASLWQLDHGVITQILPSPIVRLILNLLSRRYSVTLSEVAPSQPVETRKRFLWGQEVEDLMYWRPPQANISMSLTLMTFGDSVRLGIMTDALLSPQHLVISSTFAQNIRELATAAGVLRTPNIPSDISESLTTELPQSTSASLDLDFDSRSDEDNTNMDDYDKNNLGNIDKLKFSS